jgi:hypothetical protein
LIRQLRNKIDKILHASTQRTATPCMLIERQSGSDFVACWSSFSRSNTMRCQGCGTSPSESALSSRLPAFTSLPPCTVWSMELLVCVPNVLHSGYAVKRACGGTN